MMGCTTSCRGFKVWYCVGAIGTVLALAGSSVSRGIEPCMDYFPGLGIMGAFFEDTRGESDGLTVRYLRHCRTIA